MFYMCIMNSDSHHGAGLDINTFRVTSVSQSVDYRGFTPRHLAYSSRLLKLYFDIKPIKSHCFTAHLLVVCSKNHRSKQIHRSGGKKASVTTIFPLKKIEVLPRGRSFKYCGKCNVLNRNVCVLLPII